MSGNEGTLKQQLKNLRVADLKHIATSCNLRVHGKKADLIDRLCESAVAPLVITHLQQMSRGEFAPLGWRNNSLDGSSNPIRQKKRRLDTPYQPQEPNCLCKGLPTGTTLISSPLSVIRCPKCQQCYHDRCVGLHIDVTEGYKVAGEAPVTFLCPSCRLKDLDPFHAVMKVLYCLSLFDDPQDTTTQKTLPLRSPNIQDLRRKGCEVFIMSLKLDGARCSLIHEWPWSLTVTINKNVEKIKKPEYEHKRRDVPMKITPYLFGNTSNEIKIEAEKDSSHMNDDQWAIAVLLCSTESVESIEANVLAKARLPYPIAKALTMNNIDKFFGKKPQPISVEGGEALSEEEDEDDDDEVDIVDTSCKVKLLDPITLTRLQVPVRGKQCKHLQCFDLHSYLTVTKNAKSYANRWKCVVCNEYTRPKDLVIDSFIESLLQQSSAEAEAVVFDSNGNWEEVKVKWNMDDQEVLDDGEFPDAQTGIVKTEKGSAAVEGPIDIDDDDDDKDDDDEVQAIEPPPRPAPIQQSSTPMRHESAAAILQSNPTMTNSAVSSPPVEVSRAHPEVRSESPQIAQTEPRSYSVPRQQTLASPQPPPVPQGDPSLPVQQPGSTPQMVLLPGRMAQAAYQMPGYNISPVTQSSASPSPTLYDFPQYPPSYLASQMPMIHEQYGGPPPFNRPDNSAPQHAQPPSNRVPRHVDMTFGNWQGGLQQGAPPR